MHPGINGSFAARRLPSQVSSGSLAGNGLKAAGRKAKCEEATQHEAPERSNGSLEVV
jgi:hypothetical protein